MNVPLVTLGFILLMICFMAIDGSVGLQSVTQETRLCVALPQYSNVFWFETDHIFLSFLQT